MAIGNGNGASNEQHNVTSEYRNVEHIFLARSFSWRDEIFIPPDARFDHFMVSFCCVS